MYLAVYLQPSSLPGVTKLSPGCHQAGDLPPLLQVQSIQAFLLCWSKRDQAACTLLSISSRLLFQVTYQLPSRSCMLPKLQPGLQEPDQLRHFSDLQLSGKEDRKFKCAYHSCKVNKSRSENEYYSPWGRKHIRASVLMFFFNLSYIGSHLTVF